MNRLLAGIAGFAAFAYANAQDPSKIPIEQFIRPSEALSAKLSPDGDYIAVERYVNDFQRAVGVTELANNKITATIAFGMGEGVGAYEWVGPRRIVASLAQSLGRLDQPRLLGELFGIDADGKNKKYLFGYRGAGTEGTRIVVGTKAESASAFLVGTLRNDPAHALVTVTPWGSGEKNFFDLLPKIDRMDVVTGRRETIDKLDLLAPSIVTDGMGRNLFVSGSDRDGEIHAKARGADGKWAVVALPDDAGLSVSVHGLSHDGASAFYSTSGEKLPTCLHEYRYANGAVTQLACGEFESVVMSSAENRPIALTYEDGLPRTDYLLPDHPEARRLKAISAAFPGQRVRLASTSADGSKALLRVTSDRNPGGYYLLNEATKSLRFLVPSHQWIDPKLMQPMTPITVKASDGMQIPAYLTARDGLKTRGAPLVVLVHGGPHFVRDYWVWNHEVQLLASRGYAVLQVNYRGSGGYGRAFEVAGYRKWGTRIQQDIADVTRSVIAQGIADPARVCIYGGSFGGYAALMSAANEPDLYRCAIGYAGAYDRVIQAADSDTADSLIGRQYLESAMGTGEELRAQSPVTHAAKIKAALMIVHGTQDKRVPFAHAKAMRVALDAARKPYEWVEYEGEEHGFHKQENEVDFYTRVLAFLDQHIGPGAKPN
jgi:dipeptidyl aminopeptidase/acylaminoacyl peptidase